MKISKRGQITIPKNLRDRYGLHEDVEVEFIPEEDGIRLLKRTSKRHPVKEVFGILNRPSETNKYIEEVRGR
ncbi:MAG TPA: AbrB/MazE/SpoVT family DNA-binding domain-containing protein [Syntrophaceae bacterium]|nr:AbrB/MazE/SpoVT family DNA-binding domain-containing protein [Syntrophaceae bacterium]